MNEHDAEHDAVAERLRRFTPDSGAIDRDALIFAAGRASAKNNVGWKALAGALAASQALSLALLWPRSVAVVPTAAVQETATRQSRDRENSESIANVGPNRFRLARLRGEFFVAVRESADMPASAPVVQDKPPLRAGSTFLPSLLN
jgi:hypothetical protein